MGNYLGNVFDFVFFQGELGLVDLFFHFINQFLDNTIVKGMGQGDPFFFIICVVAHFIKGKKKILKKKGIFFYIKRFIYNFLSIYTRSNQRLKTYSIYTQMLIKNT